MTPLAKRVKCELPPARKWRLRGLPLLGVTVAACASAPATAPTLDELGRIAYRGIYEQPVTLTNGVYEGAPFVAGAASRPRVQLIDAPRAIGDLDGDGIPETAALLAESSGGSGVRTYVAIVGRHNGRPTNRATRLIGDRVQTRRLTIEGDTVVLEIIAAGPSEASCRSAPRPTRKASASSAACKRPSTNWR